MNTNVPSRFKQGAVGAFAFTVIFAIIWAIVCLKLSAPLQVFGIGILTVAVILQLINLVGWLFSPIKK